MQTTFVKSPLNYTGNKFRLLKQILPLFPKNINCMVDMFAGGATVGLNTDAKKITFVDNNEYVINLLIYLSSTNFDDLIMLIEKYIEKYRLSYSAKYGYSFYKKQCTSNPNNGLKDYNAKAYLSLKSDYNSLTVKTSEKANLMLYLLMIYEFNNDIRFNSSNEFNLPCGKTDMNRNNIDKLKYYIKRIKEREVEFLCSRFDSPLLNTVMSKADFVYMDPPYLITNAVYNQEWNNDEEYRLLDFLDNLVKEKKKWALSNVLEKNVYKGDDIFVKKNEPLNYWLYKNASNVDIKYIPYNYSSSSYNKKTRDAKEVEVLILNRV